MLKVQKYLLVFFVLSLIPTYYFMYRIISAPSDETGHALGLFMVSTIWAIVIFVLLGIFFIKNIRVKFARYMYGGLILMLPATWFFVQVSFFQIFYSKITEIHPVWKGRMMDIGTDGVSFVIFSSILFIIGLKLVVLSKKMKLLISSKV